MGAEFFETVAIGDTAQQAFDTAVRHAEWESGHGGYTGTIAEKSEFVMLTDAKYGLLEPVDPDLARAVVETIEAKGDERILSKRGPCGCIRLTPNPTGISRWMFFGWASS